MGGGFIIDSDRVRWEGESILTLIVTVMMLLLCIGSAWILDLMQLALGAGVLVVGKGESGRTHIHLEPIGCNALSLCRRWFGQCYINRNPTIRSVGQNPKKKK